jgi:hypothetical protein
VVPGHVVRFNREVQEVIYQTHGDPDPDVYIKTVIKAVLVLDGAEHCIIEFLPRMWLQDCESALVCITSLLR